MNADPKAPQPQLTSVATIHIQVDEVSIKSVTTRKGKVLMTIEADADDVVGEEHFKRVTRDGFSGLLVIDGQYEQQAIDWSGGQQPAGDTKP